MRADCACKEWQDSNAKNRARSCKDIEPSAKRIRPLLIQSATFILEKMPGLSGIFLPTENLIGIGFFETEIVLGVAVHIFCMVSD